MSLFKRVSTIAVLTLSFALFSGTAVGQVAQESVGASQEKASYSDEQIDKFVAISKKISELQQKINEKRPTMRFCN